MNQRRISYEPWLRLQRAHLGKLCWNFDVHVQGLHQRRAVEDPNLRFFHVLFRDSQVSGVVPLAQLVAKQFASTVLSGNLSNENVLCVGFAHQILVAEPGGRTPITHHPSPTWWENTEQDSVRTLSGLLGVVLMGGVGGWC